MADEAIIRIVIDELNRSSSAGAPPEPAAGTTSSAGARDEEAPLSGSLRLFRSAVDAFTTDISRATTALRQLTYQQPAPKQPLALGYTPPPANAVSASPYAQIKALMEKGEGSMKQIDAIMSSAGMTKQESRVYDLAMNLGMRHTDIAKELGVTKGRITQLADQVTNRLQLPEPLSDVLKRREAVGREPVAQGAKRRGRTGKYMDLDDLEFNRESGEKKSQSERNADYYGSQNYESATIDALTDAYMREAAKEAPDPDRLADLKAKLGGKHYAEGGIVGGGTPPESGLVVAGYGTDGKLYYGKRGQMHDDLLEFGDHLEHDDGTKYGFAGPDGRFLSREEAYEYVVAQSDRPPTHDSGYPENQLDSCQLPNFAEGGMFREGGEDWPIGPWNAPPPKGMFREGGEDWPLLPAAKRQAAGGYLDDPILVASLKRQLGIHRATGGWLDPEDNPDAYMDESDFDIPMAQVLEDPTEQRGTMQADVVQPYGAAFELPHHAEGGFLGEGTFGFRDESKLPANIADAIASKMLVLDGGEWWAGPNTLNAIVADSPEDAWSQYAKNWILRDLAKDFDTHDTAKHHADGGRIDMARGGPMPNTGAAPSGQDWHPAWLTNQEFVMNAKSTAANVNALAAANANPDIKLTPHYAVGGSVLSAVGGGVGTAVGVGIAAVGYAEQQFISSIIGATAAVGDFARSLADPDADPSRVFSGAGNAVTAAGEKWSKAINMVASPLTSLLGVDLFPQIKILSGVAGETARQFGALMQALDATSERYGEYSPDIAVAQAMVEVRHTMGELRRANESGPELAKYLRAQGDLQQKVEDVKIKLLTKIVPLVTNIVTLVEKVMPAGEGIADAIGALLAPITVTVDALNRIAFAQEDANRPEVVDPTEILFQNPGVQIPNGPGV